jgi:hypothetical protein
LIRSLFSLESKVTGIICFMDLSQRFRPLAPRHSILTNIYLKCPKVLTATHCSNEDRLQASMSTLRNVAVIQNMQMRGTRPMPYARNSARLLLQSMCFADDNVPYITLRIFLNKALPR